MVVSNIFKLHYCFLVSCYIIRIQQHTGNLPPCNRVHIHNTPWRYLVNSISQVFFVSASVCNYFATIGKAEVNKVACGIAVNIDNNGIAAVKVGVFRRKHHQ